MRSTHSLSSVTRWLLVVVGCVVLETAQPTKAADEAPPAPAPEVPVQAVQPEADAVARTGETLLIPGGTNQRPVDGDRGQKNFSSWLVLLALCAGGAGWWWWRRRTGQPLTRGVRERQIQIEESRPLGNRQYLVVASVGPKKFLLGITPGSIQMLTPLESAQEEEKSDARVA
jgi:flagellar protein FliO/FliZ